MLQELGVQTTGDKNVLEWVRRSKLIGEYRQQIEQDGPKPGELSFYEFAEEEAREARAEISRSLGKAGKQLENIWNLVEGELKKSDGPEKVYILSEIVSELAANTLKYNPDKYKFLAAIVKDFPSCLELPAEGEGESVYKKFVESVKSDLEAFGDTASIDLEEVVKFIASREKMEKQSEWEFRGAELKGYRVFEELGTEALTAGTKELAEKLGIENFEDINVKGLENAEPVIKMSEGYAALRYLARLSRISGTRQKIAGFVLGGLRHISKNNLEMVKDYGVHVVEAKISNLIVNRTKEAGVRAMMELLDLNKVSFLDVMSGVSGPLETGLPLCVLEEMKKIMYDRGVSKSGGFVLDKDSELATEIGKQHMEIFLKRGKWVIP